MKTTAWDRMRAGGDQHEGLWLISYADMITLLLTFFVALLSTAKIQKDRFERMSAALNQRATQSQLQQLEAKVGRWAAEAGLRDKLTAELGPDGLRVQFTNALLFESGKATLTAEGTAVVDRFLGLLASVDPTYRVTIEGHSDDVPIANPTFRSNWELSSQRAIEVLGRLKASGIDERRMSVQGFADTRPVAAAQLPRGLDAQAQLAHQRSLNRRVVIMVH